MLRILVTIEESAEYGADETLEFANQLAGYIKKRLNRKFRDIDSDTDWFVGFVNMPVARREDVKDVIYEWAETEGVGTYFYVEDMEDPEEGPCCGYHDCVCEGCDYAFQGKEPCRIGCLYG